MKVSRAAYYEWRRQRRRAQEDRQLTEKMQAILDGSPADVTPNIGSRSRRLSQASRNGAAYSNGPRRSAQYVERARAWKSEAHCGTGGSMPYSDASLNPNLW
jgi:hypothetical protein